MRSLIVFFAAALFLTGCVAGETDKGVIPSEGRIGFLYFYTEG